MPIRGIKKTLRNLLRHIRHDHQDDIYHFLYAIHVFLKDLRMQINTEASIFEQCSFFFSVDIVKMGFDEIEEGAEMIGKCFGVIADCITDLFNESIHGGEFCYIALRLNNGNKRLKVLNDRHLIISKEMIPKFL